MQKRNMLIRQADRSAGGWMTVQEYMPDELSSDSEDSRKMRQAENRATKKRKLAFPRKPSSTCSSATQFHRSNLGNPTPPYKVSKFWNALSQAKDKDRTLYNQITSGDFKTPLTTVTTVKLEVNPNKTDADIKYKYFDLFDWLCSDQVLKENYFD